MRVAEESGNQGQLISLGGVKGMPGRGRQFDIYYGLAGLLSQVVPDNPKRISLLVVNYGLTNLDVYLSINSPAASVELLPGGSFQIDSNFPWTGPVILVGVPAVAYLITEISVP